MIHTKSYKQLILLLLLLSITASKSFAQQPDLFKETADSTKKLQTDIVRSTFKTTRLINGHSCPQCYTINLAYLDKPVEVTGEITEVKQDQTGNTTLTLKSGDAFAGVFCTINSTENKFKPGQQITIKGICTGFLSDVVLKDAIVMK